MNRFKEWISTSIYVFSVLIEGLKFNSEVPKMIGKTFLRLVSLIIVVGNFVQKTLFATMKMDNFEKVKFSLANKRKQFMSYNNILINRIFVGFQ